MKSPCNQTCRLNEKRYCIGCLRHVEEIRKWSAYTLSERTSIMFDLPKRLGTAVTEEERKVMTKALEVPE